jgi:hypothetical protein
MFWADKQWCHCPEKLSYFMLRESSRYSMQHNGSGAHTSCCHTSPDTPPPPAPATADTNTHTHTLIAEHQHVNSAVVMATTYNDVFSANGPYRLLCDYCSSQKLKQWLTSFIKHACISESLSFRTLSATWNSEYVENTTFRKLGLFACSGEGEGNTYCVGSLTKSQHQSLVVRFPLSDGPNTVGYDM